MKSRVDAGLTGSKTCVLPGMPHVAIAGAGIGGLAAALALARCGCRVTLIERAPALAEIGAGLQLSPNATAVLRRLGVLDAVAGEAVAVEAVEIGRGRDGARLARMPLGSIAEARFGAPFLVTLRADLQKALLDAALATGAVTLLAGHTLAGWRETPEGLRLDLGGASLVADALVGADGHRSAVRDALWGRPGPVTARRSAWRTTIDMGSLPAILGAPCSRLWLGPGAHVVHYPVAAGRRVNVVVALDEPRAAGPADDTWARAGDPADLARRLGGFAGPVPALLAAAPAWGRWPLFDTMPARSWSKGTVTLLGDAAHAMLPFLAQGAAQAIEDAAALADAVAARPSDLQGAFAAYEAARRPRAARVVAASRRQGTVYHLAGPPARARDAVLRLTPSGRLLERYAWLYEMQP